MNFINFDLFFRISYFKNNLIWKEEFSVFTYLYMYVCLYTYMYTQFLHFHWLVWEGYKSLRGKKNLRPITKKQQQKIFWVQKMIQNMILLFPSRRQFAHRKSIMNEHEWPCPMGRCHRSLPFSHPVPSYPVHLPLAYHEMYQIPPSSVLETPGVFGKYETRGVP